MSNGWYRQDALKTITIKSRLEPERYQAFYEAMMNDTEIEGGYITCGSEYTEAGEKIAKFTIREADENRPEI